MTVITNTNIIKEDGIVFDGVVAFDDKAILYAGEKKGFFLSKNAKVIDAKGLYTAPGLIDIHNHGTKDFLFTDEPQKCCEFFIKHGETTILPTLYCSLSKQEMLDGYKRIKKTCKSAIGNVIGGLYMEGPYMNGYGSNQKYIQWTGKIDKKEYADLVDELGDFAKIWAIDPARKGIDKFMKYVKSVSPNAIFTMGHSFATAEDCEKIRKYGVKLQTHHGDSGKAKGPNQVTIGAGCDEFTLYNPDIYAELICDEVGVHLPPYLIKMVVRTKGVEKIILITDSMPGGDFKNNEKEGVAFGPDLNYDYEGHLAGSHLTLDNACRNIMRHTGYGLCHAIRFASINPARLLGIDDKVGSIEVGKKPNLIIIDDKIDVKNVFLNGKIVFNKGQV